MKYELRLIVRDDQEIRQLRCPRCGVWGDLDDDQYHGQVSVYHAEVEGGCGYHETHDFSLMSRQEMG